MCDSVLMLNHRTDVQFIFVRDFFGVPSLFGESEVIEVVNKDAPHYVHLAVTDTPKCDHALRCDEG